MGDRTSIDPALNPFVFPIRITVAKFAEVRGVEVMAAVRLEVPMKWHNVCPRLPGTIDMSYDPIVSPISTSTMEFVKVGRIKMVIGSLVEVPVERDRPGLWVSINRALHSLELIPSRRFDMKPVAAMNRCGRKSSR